MLVIKDPALDEKAYQRRDAILGAVSFAAESILGMEPLPNILNRVLERLGESAEVNWIRLYQNKPIANGKLSASLCGEWLSEKATTDKIGETLREIAHEHGGFQRLRLALSQGEIVVGHTKKFSEAERELSGGVTDESILFVPIFIGLEWLGFVSLGNNEEQREWTRIEIATLKTAANIIGAILRRSMADKVRSATLRISESAHSAQDLTSLYKSIHEIIDDLMPARNFYIALYDPEENLINFVYDVDEFDGPFLPQKPGKGLTEYVLRTGIPLFASPEVFEDLVAREEVVSIGTPSIDWLGVPLIAENKTIGVLAVQSYTEGIRFSNEDMEILTFVSNQIAMAIERRRAEDARLESDERYRSLVENIPIGLFQCTPGDTGEFIMANPALLSMLGIDSSEQLWTINPDDIFSGLDDRKMIEGVLLASGNIHGLDMQLKKRDGSLIWCSLTARVEKDQFGNIAYFDYSVEDISLRVRRAQEREALISFASILRTAQTRSEMVSVVLSYLSVLTKADSAAILFSDIRGDHLWVEGCRGYWEIANSKHQPLNPELTRGVILVDKPFKNNAVNSDPLYVPTTDYCGPTAVLCVPMSTERMAMGAIWLGRDHPFLEEDVQLLTAIGDMAATAFHRAALHEQTQRRVQHLSALRAVDMAISSTMDLRVVLNVLLEQLRAQLRIDATTVLLYKPHTQTLEYAAGRGFHSDVIDQTRISLSDKVIGKSILNHRLVRIDDTSQLYADFIRARGLMNEMFRVYYAVPLVAKGQLVGVLELFHRNPFPSDQEWLDFLDMLAGQAAIAIDNATLFNDLQRSNMELHLAYDTTLESWAKTLNMHMGEEADHTNRIIRVCLRLASEIGISENDLISIRRGAMLHDIGMMAVPEAILLKSEQLTNEEVTLIHKHPDIAREILSPIPSLRQALTIPYHHHESWDGSGYPRGLKGTEIPITARVFSIVDVWDALSTDRPYRKAWSTSQIYEYIDQQGGILFDPEITNRFLALREEIQ